MMDYVAVLSFLLYLQCMQCCFLVYATHERKQRAIDIRLFCVYPFVSTLLLLLQIVLEVHTNT